MASDLPNTLRLLAVAMEDLMIRLYNLAHGQPVADGIEIDVERVQTLLEDLRDACRPLDTPRIWFESHIFPVYPALPQMIWQTKYEDIQNNVGIIAKHYEAVNAMIERDNRSRMLTTESGQYDHDAPLPLTPMSNQDVGALIASLAFWVNQVSEHFNTWVARRRGRSQVSRSFKMLQSQLTQYEKISIGYLQKIIDKHYLKQDDLMASLNRFCTSPAAKHPDLSNNAYRKHPTVVYSFIDDVIVGYDQTQPGGSAHLNGVIRADQYLNNTYMGAPPTPAAGFSQSPYWLNASLWFYFEQQARSTFVAYEHWLYASTCCVGGALGDTQALRDHTHVLEGSINDCLNNKKTPAALDEYVLSMKNLVVEFEDELAQKREMFDFLDRDIQQWCPCKFLMPEDDENVKARKNKSLIKTKRRDHVRDSSRGTVLEAEIDIPQLAKFTKFESQRVRKKRQHDMAKILEDHWDELGLEDFHLDQPGPVLLVQKGSKLKILKNMNGTYDVGDY